VVLVVFYVLFVAVIWYVERRPPALGEAGELEEAKEHEVTGRGRVGRELVMVLAGVTAMALGASALVESIRRISGVESTQARLGLIVVGFATAFELVVLAWSAARRGITAAVVAGVVGSFTYNATMTLGAGALARPLRVTDAQLLRGPWVIMVGSLIVVVALAWRTQRLDRRAGIACLALYPLAVVAMLVVT